jgi:hypothetical protein
MTKFTAESEHGVSAFIEERATGFAVCWGN